MDWTSIGTGLVMSIVCMSFGAWVIAMIEIHIRLRIGCELLAQKKKKTGKLLFKDYSYYLLYHVKKGIVCTALFLSVLIGMNLLLVNFL